MARKPVERLRPSARLQAVARPVETYVRPAAQPEATTGLGEFISAIAPAAKTLAQIEKEKQLKLQREAERGIAAARAFDARLGAGKALRAAYEDFNDPANQEAYLNMTDEQVRDKRAEIMQPFFDKVQQSGDDKLALAFQQDIEVGNLDFFTKSYDPLKSQFDLNNSLNEVFTEVLAIQDNPMLDDSLKDKATDNLLKTYQAATGTPWNAINEYAVKTTANRVSQDGRTSLYRWLKKEGQLGVSKYQDTVRTIDTRLASYDTERLKLGKDEFFNTTVRNQVLGYLQSQDVMSLGGSVTFKDGTSRAIKDEDLIAGIQAVASQLGMKEKEAIEQLYRPLNIVPTEEANAIMSGKSLLSFGDTTDENVMLMSKAYIAFKKLDGYKFTIKDALMSSDEKKLMRAMDYLLEKKGVGPDGPAIGAVREALEMVRTIDLSTPVRKASTTEIQNALDQGITDISDFDEVKNTNVMLPYIQDGVDLYMQMGIPLIEATKQAVKDARKDFIVVESSTGTKHALPILNTAIDRKGNEVAQLQSYINEEAKRPSTVEAIAARGGTGVVLQRTTNPKMFNVAVVNENGLPVGSLGDIPMDVALDPKTVRTMIAERIARTVEDDVYVSGQMGVILEPIEVFDTDATVAAKTPTLESMDVQTVPIVTQLPESLDITTGREIQEEGVPTGLYLYEGVLPDGSKVMYRSYQKPEKALPPEAVQTVPQATDQLADMAAREAQEADEIEPIRQTVTDIIQEMNKDGSLTPVTEFINKERDALISRALAAKAVKDMQGTTKEKKSFISSLLKSIIDTTSPAQAGQYDRAGNVDNMEGTTTMSKATNLIMSQEGFEPTPYPDGKDRSVGYGFYLPSLEPDELALIKDVENITKEEADAVLALKVDKIEKYMVKELPDIDTLSQEAQAAVASMMFQLGKENVKTKFPTFFKNLMLATQAPVGSAEREQYLKIASDNMVYNFKNGKQTSKTLWHKQTPNRAKAMAALVANG
jgi:GH24 family phage-related lysozyme (muramidase)